MPAYDLNGAYSIFFIIFMLVNFYIFINIILATIYTNYKKHLKVSSFPSDMARETRDGNYWVDVCQRKR